jgi:hypothetical protein
MDGMKETLLNSMGYFNIHFGNECILISLLYLYLNKTSLCVFTFSIVWYSRNQKTGRFGNWICFRPQVRG